LIQRYFTEPYRFFPPQRGDLWCRIAKLFLPWHLNHSARLTRWQFRGLDLLRQSVADGAGIVLAANHSRWSDGAAFARLGIELDLFFYYMVSYHIFRISRPTGWCINRLGCYSVWREGTDREAMRATAHLLAAAERPVVVFPEGTWFRQNDRLGPLQDGLSLIFRIAAKLTERPLRVHPVTIKYWNLDDARPALRARLARLEQQIGWQPQHDLELVARIEKLGSALLAIKENEFLGAPQSGTIDERRVVLVESLVTRQEKYYLGREFDGHSMERVRRLRQRLARQLFEQRDDAEMVGRLRRDLDTLLLCENVNAQSLEYLKELPSIERLSETVQRIEETVFDGNEVPVGDLGVAVEVLPALDARSYVEPGRAGSEPLIRELSSALQGNLDRVLADGPPAAWGCPPSLVAQRVLADSRA
jgi:1-acyl-sn-glycerol-3-phosphate acyltransferase